MEQDFKSMKRNELQALCKKHGLPANSTNLKMAASLASLLQKEHKSEEINPKGCLKGSGGSSGEDVGRTRGVSKKVSFSLVEDKPEFDELQRKSDDKYSPKKRRFSRRRSSIALRPVETIEEDEVVEVPERNTRSRSLAVAVMWSPGVEKKQGRKRMEAVCQNDEPPHVVKLPSPNKRNKRKAEIELSHDVPATRTLRNRVVVVKGDEELVRDSKPRRAETKRIAKEKNEASIAPLLQEDTIAKEVENDKVFGGKSCPKHLRGSVSVEEIDAYNGSEMVSSCEEPPLRRSKRIRKPDNKLEEGKKSKGDAVSEMIRPKNSRNGSLQVLVTAVNNAEKQEAEETEMAPQIGEALKSSKHYVSKGNEESGLGTSLLASGGLNDECVAVAGKFLSKKRRNNAPNGRDLAPTVPDGDMLNDTAAKKVNRGKLCEHKEPPRRSTRSSSMHRVLDHETNDVRIVRKNEPVKQEKNTRTRRGTVESAGPSSEIETSLQAQESQGKPRRGSQAEEGPRHLRCNASEYSIPGHEISLPDGRNLLDDETNKRNELQKRNKPELEISLLVGGKSVDETNRGKNLQKRRRGRILGKPGSEAVVPDCKTAVDAENLEENESSKEPQMKFKHDAAKVDSCSDTVPGTLADEKQKYEKLAESQTVGLQFMEAKFSGYTATEDWSSSFCGATNHEDSNGGNKVAKITDEFLSCNRPEVLSAAIVEGDSAAIFPNFKTSGMPVEVHDVSKMASQVDCCLLVDTSDNQERAVQLSTTVAGSDLEDMLNQQKVCRNGMVNCGAAEDTTLNAGSTPKESDDVKQCSETVAKPSDPHISEIAADEGKDNSSNFSLFINSGKVGLQSGENNFEEDFKDEITQSFPLNVCSDEVGISYEEFPKGDCNIMQSDSSNNVVDYDSDEKITKYRELSPSELVEVTCGINETVQEVKEKSKTSFDDYLHAKHEEQVTIQVNSIISKEQEEALEIGLDKEFSCSKVMEVQSETPDLLSERPAHSNVEAVVQVESVRDFAPQGNLNVDNNIANLLLNDGCIYKKQDEVQDVFQVTELKSPASTIVADNNENPVDAFHCENSNKRNETRGFGGVILPSTCPEDLSIVTAAESSSWIDDEEPESAKQENVYDAIGVGSHIDGPSTVHPICGLDSNGKDLLSLQTRSVGLTRDAMLNGQSDGGGCDIMGVRKKNLLNDTATGEHLPDNQKDSKNEGETCGAVSSDIYSHKSTPGECEVLDKFREDLMEDNQSQLCNFFSCKVLPEQSNLELREAELQETNETDACWYASDDNGAASNESMFAQTILEKRVVVDAGETLDLSNNQKIIVHVHQVSTDSSTKIINDSESGGGLRDKHADQKAKLDILDGIMGDEGELKGSVGNKENTAPSNKFDGEVVHKPVVAGSAACKEMILRPEHVGSVGALRTEQGPLSYMQNVEGIDKKEVRKFDWSVLEGKEAFKDKDAEEKLDAKFNSINCNEVDDIVSAENVHNNGAGGALISIAPSIAEYTLEKSEHSLDNGGKLPITKRAHEVLSALKSEVDEASFIIRLLIGSKDLITQNDKEISPKDAVDQVGFAKIVCKNGALDEANPYCINPGESLCSISKNDKAVLASQFDLEDRDDDNGIQYLKTSGIELDCGHPEEYDISGNRDHTDTSASHLSYKSCKQDKEKVKATSSEGKFSSSNKAPFFCISSESKSKDVWVAPGAKLICLEDLFQMESEVSYVMNGNARAAFRGSQSDEEYFEHESNDSMDIMATDEDKASGKREEMDAMPLLSDVLVQKECGGQADTVEKNGGLHGSLEALGCENSYVVGTVSGSPYSEPVDRMKCQASIQLDEQKMLRQEPDIIDNCEGVKPVDFCHAVLTEGNASGNYATDGHEDQEREETLNRVSPLIGGTGVDEKACSLDCIELASATRETKIQDADVSSRSLIMVQGEAVLESCTESFRSPFICAESEGRENTFADEVAGRTSIIEAAVEVVTVEDSRSKEILSSAEGVSILLDENVGLDLSDIEIVKSSDTAVAKKSKREEDFEDLGMSMVETVDLVGSSKQSPMGSPVECEIGPNSDDALDSEESSRRSGPDRMEEISCKLLNFRISSAKKACKAGFYNSTPLKLVENSRCHSVIDGSKGKENTPIIKMDHSYKHNLDKSANTRSSRPPLRSLPKQ